MKHFLLLICLIFTLTLTAQDYQRSWEKVIEFEADGLIKSAAEVTDKIYTQAKKDKNEPQLIKAFFFKSKYLQELDEQAQSKIITSISAEIKTATPATAAFLESLYAGMLWDVYRQQSHIFDERTPIDSLTTTNFLEWDGKLFRAQINTAFANSLKNREMLYKVPLANYKAVIEFNPLSTKINRSLYDFLAERYINNGNDYYRYSDNIAIKPIAENLFANTQKFQNTVIPVIDSKSFRERILFCIELEKYYAAKNDTNSLQRSVLRRLEYVNEQIESLGKKDIYINILENLSKSWDNGVFAYKAKFELAKLYKETADKTKHPDYIIKAVALCNDIIANTTISAEGPQAIMLKNTLVNTVITLQTQKYVLPNKPILAKVNFKNTDSLQISIYKMNVNDIVISKEKLQGIIALKKPIEEKLYILPKKQDYFEHDTEIILPALTTGNYLIVAGKNNKDKLYGHLFLQATQLTLVEQVNGNTYNYQVTNRETGAPVSNAKINAEGKILYPDRDGRVTITGIKNNGKKKEVYSASSNRLNTIVSYKGDTLRNYFQNGYYDYNETEDDKMAHATTNLFTDRAIYRPGQTVYFKGIVVQYKNNGLSVVPNVYIEVTIKSHSISELKSFRLKTNEFGSFSGEFNLPLNVRTGEFYIKAESDSDPEKDVLYNKKKDEHPFWDYVDYDVNELYFEVEDYKRPTFNINFNPVKADIHVNETATLTGIAKAYSGAAIAGAKVKYRVEREAYMTRYNYYGNYNSDVITGETVTDANGNFSVNFIAKPNNEYDAKGLPIFTYTVYADVTDSTGETHTSTGHIRVGYHSLELSVSIPKVVNPKNNTSIIIDSKNLNGQFTPSSGTITIYKIADKGRVLTERPWPAPELQTIPEADFVSAFPYTPYNNVQQDSVIHSKTVFTQQVNTATQKEINLKNFTNWQLGAYELVFTANDRANNLVQNKIQFLLEQDTDIQITNHKLFSYKIKNNDYQKTGYVLVEVKSAVHGLYVNASADKNGKTFNTTVQLKNGINIIKIPINTNLKRCIVFLDYVWQNSFYGESITLNTEAAAGRFEITTAALNNKLLPGNKEIWSFTIKGEKLPAEVMSSMYDASLDQFASRRWDLLLPNNGHSYTNLRDRSVNTDGTTYIQYNNLLVNSGSNIYNYEQRLNTFGFDINRSKMIYTIYKPKSVATGKPISTGTTYLLTGVVTDVAGQPIPGVTVSVNDSEINVQTDFDGIYSIPVIKGNELAFMFIGMKTQNTIIESDVINITMEDDAAMLNDVVVEAYRANPVQVLASGTIIVVENEGGATFLRTLQGQVPGLNISQGSGAPGGETTVILRGYGSVNGNANPLYVIDGMPLSENEFRNINPNDIGSLTILKDASATSVYGNRGANGVIIIKTKQGDQELKALQQVTARKNFNETAFFYPQLRTDKEGKISFNFTSPEALTEWKLRLLAHNKKAVSGYFENTFVTQKELMVVPNMPRFLREKDTITIITKVNNLTAEVKEGNALLQLFDAVTMQPIDSQMLNIDNLKPFTLTAKGSSTVSWKIAVPAGLQGVQYKILARAGDFSDGEENILPVLTNKMLVTESIPLWVKPNSTKTYTFENLKNNTSATLRNQGITLEYTSNPAWVALQSLPYLMEFEHECAEQVFSRYYANTIALRIISGNPKINALFETWRKQEKPLSKLEQNQELKSIIMSESPWMLDKLSDDEQKSRLALLFDLKTLSDSQATSFMKLYKKQLPSGGFAWFDGGQEDEYITRHILAGFGHLKKLGYLAQATASNELISNAIHNIDSKFLQKHKQFEKDKKKNKSLIYSNTNTNLHYLYARSFYLQQYPLNDSLKAAVKMYVDVAKQNWLNYSLYEKGLAALILNRFSETATAKRIINNLKVTSATNDENGMYWINNKAGWQWYHAPIETQALLIEAFIEVDTDIASADAMKVWLIKNKQTKNWPTTKATSEAVYVLLMQGSDWLSVKDNTVIQLGDAKLFEKKLSENGKEAETGYLKLNWKPKEVTKDVATVSIQNKSAVPGYGGFYWQYFEDLDKIKPAQDGLMNISTELFLKTTTATGPQLQKITPANPLKIGSLVTVRLVLNIKEDVEYVHLKDLRAAAFEPVDVISNYEYKDGLGYYRSTRDAATHFFFDHINKGTYVLEYDVRVNNAGEFSNGITTLQSMYAPEFSGHTKGGRVKTVE